MKDIISLAVHMNKVHNGKYFPQANFPFYAFNNYHEIPKTYEGGPTVPRLLRWLVPPERIVRAGYLHDALGHYYKDVHPKVVYDAMFYQAARQELHGLHSDLPAWRRWQIAACAYVGVRIADALKIKQHYFE